MCEIGMKELGWGEDSLKKHTKIDDVTLKILKLRPIDRNCGDIASVVMVVNTDGDLGSPVDNTEFAAVGILPVGVDFGGERLESGVVFLLLLQGAFRASQGRAVCPARLRLQVFQLNSAKS